VGQSLSQDVAIVTGGRRGIGRAIALSLAGQGAAVGVFARTPKEITETASLISAAGGRALGLQVDVRDAAAVRAAAAETASRLGPVTLLVNNAGTPVPAGRDWEVDPEAWCECIDVIVRGALFLAQAGFPDDRPRFGTHH
jgi:NAD(P)-dependent dehydrogenase (short-subunit alcohol dehydrogenase family)